MEYKQLAFKEIAPELLEWPPCPISPSVLQSFLQKAVRRGRADLAVRAAATMWSMGGKARLKLVRRVPIIVIEDAVLSPNFDALVDVMVRVSRKGYLEREEDLKLLLSSVIWAAESEVRDFWNPDDKRLDKPEADLAKLDELPDKERRLVKALLLRRSYGGMRIDQQMLLITARWWVYRFLHDRGWELINRAYPEPAPEVHLDALYAITVEDLHELPMAIDGHCSGVPYILARKPEVRAVVGDVQAVNDLIWRRDASVNFKVEEKLGEVYDWPPELEDEHQIWDWLEPEVRSIQHWWIDRRIGGRSSRERGPGHDQLSLPTFV